MSDDQFSNELKKAIEKGFAVVNKQTRTATIGANLAGYSRTIWGILLLVRDVQGHTSELTMRHGYTVSCDPACHEYLSLL
ncbi:MAG: hypothetical protein QOH63_439 [Acidobacteriota bacterium]|nr:hypothetical protein [Acidobacteriota bacterium]